MCGGGPPPGTSCDSTALTMPLVSRPWMRMTIGMPRTFSFLPPSEGIWIGFMNFGVDVPPPRARWQHVNSRSQRDIQHSAAETQRTKESQGTISAEYAKYAEAARKDRSSPLPRAQRVSWFPPFTLAHLFRVRGDVWVQ